MFKRGKTVIAAANGDLKGPTMIAQSLLHHRGRCRLSSKPILVTVNTYVWDWLETTVDPNQGMQHADEFRWQSSSFCSACFIRFLRRFGSLSALIVPVVFTKARLCVSNHRSWTGRTEKRKRVPFLHKGLTPPSRTRCSVMSTRGCMP